MFEQGFLTEEQSLSIGKIPLEELKEWTRKGYAVSEESYLDHPMLYYPTRKAREFLRERGIKVYVEWLRRPPAKNEVHDRRLTDLRILFEQLGYPAWQSERCLHQRGMKKVRPDAIVSTGRAKIAIELEISMKGRLKYAERFRFYEEHPAIDAVFYVVATPKQRQRILELAAGYPKIYVVLLRNLTKYGGKSFVERPGFDGAVCLGAVIKELRQKRFRQFF